MKKIPLFLLSALVLAPLSACSTVEEENTSVTTTVKVTGVTLNETAKSMEGGETFQLVATVLPENATNKKVKFVSGKPNVASVDSTGLITALSSGTSNVSAITVDGSFFAQCKVTVVSHGVAPSNPGEETTPSTPSTPSTPTTPDEPSTPSTPDTPSTPGEPEQPVTPNVDEETVHEVTIQDNTVLHCWNWSMNTIKNNLNDIAAAGFKTIQLSPMQPQKDYYQGKWEGQWWKLYQPLGFSIAQSGQNVLGTKDELRSMCEAAEAKGIKVIVDVVANHLAGGTDKSLDWNVRNFEPDIYSQNLIHQLGDKTNTPGYNGFSEYVIRGAIGGFPDLQTENSIVQNRVLSLLKEYIDVGVDGFRFDAAKHIETPDDGEYASQFWPNVLGGATAYAKSKGLDTPYYYGEILTTPGTKRDFEWYTKYMSVTDNEEGTRVLDAVEGGSVNTFIDTGYRTRLPANKLMLWAESHDTFANDWGSTIGSDSLDVNKAYCIQASRKDASTLYFARALRNLTNEDNHVMGEIGEQYYKGADIKAANLFHNKVMFSQEKIHTSEGCFVNERGTKGIAIVGVANTSNQVTVLLENVESGSYVNLVNNQNITVSGNQVTVTLTSGVAFLIRSDII